VTVHEPWAGDTASTLQPALVGFTSTENDSGPAGTAQVLRPGKQASQEAAVSSESSSDPQPSRAALESRKSAMLTPTVNNTVCTTTLLGRTMAEMACSSHSAGNHSAIAPLESPFCGPPRCLPSRLVPARVARIYIMRASRRSEARRGHGNAPASLARFICDTRESRGPRAHHPALAVPHPHPLAVHSRTLSQSEAPSQFLCPS
jgi:hypothetical protein